MSKNVNVVIASPKTGMKGRAYTLPNDTSVKPGQKLVCESDDGVQQIVTCLSPNIEVNEDDMHSFLDKWGCEGDKVLPAIALVEEVTIRGDDDGIDILSALDELKKAIADSVKDDDEEEDEDEDEDDKPKRSVEEMLHLVESGIDSLSSLLQSIRNSKPLDCEAVADALFDVNEDLFKANMKAFALDVAITVGSRICDLGSEEDKE